MNRTFWLGAVIALVTLIAGAALDWSAFLHSWLAAVLTWLALPLGALPVLMTHGLTGGRWGEQSRALWRAQVATLPLLVFVLAPLAWNIEVLFPWAAPLDTLPELVRNKRLYLNEPFFLVRTLLYFFIWLSLAALVARRRGHAPGLILWFLSVTFFGIDWFLSLEPLFYSDVFGLMLTANMIAAAMAVAFLGSRPAMDTGARQDLANLWLSVLIGWLFLAFSQLIIVWSGNLPGEIDWYLHRAEHGWRWVGRLSLLLFFVAPFAVLLSSAAKRRADWLRLAAALCLTGHVLLTHWLVLPAFGAMSDWQYLFTPLSVTALGALHAGLVTGWLQRKERNRG